MESVLTYENYRLFLADYYTEHKEYEPGFSWRAFAQRSGFGSPVFLKLVADGVKNLGASSIDRVVEAVGFSPEEAAYFHALVQFNHSDTDHERNFHFSKMAAIRKRIGIAVIQNNHFDYFSEWYIPVVREVIAGQPTDLPLSTIAKTIRPKVSVAQIKHAITVLTSIGFIKVDNGIWRQASALLATDPQIHSLAIRNFHDQMLSHASLAIREIPRERRTVSGLILKISAQGYDIMANRIDEFRDELLRIASADSEVDRVYQVGIQLFPLTINSEE